MAGKGRTMPLTFGEKVVRASFNPSGNSSVDTFKEDVAVLIDRINEFRQPYGNRGPYMDSEHRISSGEQAREMRRLKDQCVMLGELFCSQAVKLLTMEFDDE